MTLVAYHGNPDEKVAILAQLAAHREADELIKGQYWENGKGCAVGCTLHGRDHMEYEPRFGIPVMLARLEDAIFEGLPNGGAWAWPERFMDAIVPGADLSRVGWQLLHWLLTEPAVNPGIKHPLVSDAIQQCANVIASLRDGRQVNELEAMSAAWSAAASAARGAARGAAVSAARSAAWSAVQSAWSVERAAMAAWSAAAMAAWSAATAAGGAARGAAWNQIGDKLIELLKAAPLAERVLKWSVHNE